MDNGMKEKMMNPAQEKDYENLTAAGRKKYNRARRVGITHEMAIARMR